MRIGPTHLGDPKPQPPPRLYAVSFPAKPLAARPGRLGKRGLRVKAWAGTASQETCHARLKPSPSGVTGKETWTMINKTGNTIAATGVRADTGLAAILFVAFIGATLLFTAGFANSAMMHDAAHDTRHSIGFPCH
jgi:cobalt transporter subunit CbtB